MTDQPAGAEIGRAAGEPGRPAEPWAGTTNAGPGWLSFTGTIGHAAMHTHAAIQVLELAEGAVVLRDAAGTRRRTATAVIPAGVAHQITAAPAAQGIVTYLDPVSRTGRWTASQLAAAGSDPARVTTWLAAVGLSAHSSPGGAADRPLHPALAAAAQLLPDLVGGPMQLGEVAARVGLSPSRLGHLFADQLGLPYPTWRRWARLQHALGAVQTGASLTTAAHAAGFADSAHLTRACRAMFGITPSHALRAITHHGDHGDEVRAGAGRP